MVNQRCLYGCGHLGEPDQEVSFKQFVKVIAPGDFPEAIYKAGDAYARPDGGEGPEARYRLYKKRCDNCGDLTDIKGQAAFHLAELVACEANEE